MVLRSQYMAALSQWWRKRKILSSITREDSLAQSILRLQGYVETRFDRFQREPYLLGRCPVCGSYSAFFCGNRALYRESLVCAECLTTSRYRSIARGILQAIKELTGIEADSLAALPSVAEGVSLKMYDTQIPFYYATLAYPLPDLFTKCEWIDVWTSGYWPQLPWGSKLGPHTTNQNLEELTFPDNSFHIVITSDVMEHVRLDDKAHREIRRVLRPGGIYLFTVPHFRDRRKTLIRVAITDPADPTKDQFLIEKEYHGDANGEGGQVLSYRAYGTDLDETLTKLGFTVDYWRQDFPEMGIMNTELFFCRLSK